MGNKTTRTGYYSKDNPPAVVMAPPRRTVTGLAPWLRQATGGTRALPPATPGSSASAGGAGGQPWYTQQVNAINSSNAAAVEQRQAQLRQAELLRQQAEAEKNAVATQTQWGEPIRAIQDDYGNTQYIAMQEEGRPYRVDAQGVPLQNDEGGRIFYRPTSDGGD